MKFKLNKIQSAISAAIGFALASSVSAATLLENGNFDEGDMAWETPAWWGGDGAGTTLVDERGRFCTTTTEAGVETWSAQLRQNDLPFTEGETYTVKFKAWSSSELSLNFGANDEAAGEAIFNEWAVPIDTALDDEDGQSFEFEFVAEASTEKAKFAFQMGPALLPVGETICIDDVDVIPPGKNILSNGDFDDGTLFAWEAPAWWGDDGAGTSEVDDLGRFCASTTTDGENDWSAQFRQTGLTFVADRTYTVSFDAWASADIGVQYDVIDEEAGFVLLLDSKTNEDVSDTTITARLDDEAQQFTADYTVEVGSDEVYFRFLFGGGVLPEGETICLDNIKIVDPEANSIDQPAEPEVAAVTVNQHGYYPGLSKLATYKVVTEEGKDEPRDWSLVNSKGEVVTSGKTSLIGDDANSGQFLHHIDFSSYSKAGQAYVLSVTEGEETVSSFPFDIATNLLTNTKYEALSYFYHNRAGIDILASVVGDDKWARPGGHFDESVSAYACKTSTDPSDDIDETLVGCRTGVDVSKGWYDAGDHGKYVVNGGISVWTLLNQYERSKHLGENAADFGPGSMSLPKDEKENNLPDILDEVKWEIDFILKMQIPAGEHLAGMAYHKMHNNGWTGIPQMPHLDEGTRYLQAPTTTATLNLAAVGAQCYRIYKEFDADFADMCLEQAKVAYLAGKANPLLLAGQPSDAPEIDPAAFVMTNDFGGGVYNDIQPLDELYWAAAELYISTGDDFYKAEMEASPYHLSYGMPEQGTGVPNSLYYWGNTNMLGTISLATAGASSGIDSAMISASTKLIVDAADSYAQWANDPGYSVGMDTSHLDWGSNSGVVNNMMVLGLANDLTGQQDTCYVDAMANSLGYLMGNNPLNFSYVSGYGENALQNPHHRFWAFEADQSFPMAPPASLSGGPNSVHSDPVSLRKLNGCIGETCFIDDIESWSTNEITVNWNAPFAWVTAYLDEKAVDVSEATICESRPHVGENDADQDGILDAIDNCPADANPGQWDKDEDNIGNECDLDIDGDSFSNEVEIAAGTKPWDASSFPEGDSDNDGIDDAVDNCPQVANPGQWDKDKDNIGNKCDLDIDGDSFTNDIEIAAGTKPWDASSFPTGDSDKDGIDDSVDNCPEISNSGQWDKDKDEVGNACDTDIDGDGFSNQEEREAGSKVWQESSTPINP